LLGHSGKDERVVSIEEGGLMENDNECFRCGAGFVETEENNLCPKCRNKYKVENEKLIQDESVRIQNYLKAIYEANDFKKLLGERIKELEQEIKKRQEHHINLNNMHTKLCEENQELEQQLAEIQETIKQYCSDCIYQAECDTTFCPLKEFEGEQ